MTSRIIGALMILIGLRPDVLTWLKAKWFEIAKGKA